MKRVALMALLAVFVTAPALAQPAPPPPGPGDGPPPEMREHMLQARDAARTGAMNALSSDHQSKVNAILARIKAGQLTDAHDAAQAIDAVLTPKESQAVLAARDKMMADMRLQGGDSGPGFRGGPDPGGDPPPPPAGGGTGGAGGPPGGGPPPGGEPAFGVVSPRDGSPPGGGRHRGHAMRNDAGFVLLTLSLDRDQMRSLFADARPPR